VLTIGYIINHTQTKETKMQVEITVNEIELECGKYFDSLTLEVECHYNFEKGQVSGLYSDCYPDSEEFSVEGVASDDFITYEQLEELKVILSDEYEEELIAICKESIRGDIENYEADKYEERYS